MNKLLLHTCCAPCACYPVQECTGLYSITLHYYNPNIAPFDEYERRKSELERFASEKEIPLIIGERNDREWTERVRKYSVFGEKSERCWICYRMRMEKTFITASEKGYDTVGTVLSVSPHKDSGKILETGRELSAQYGIKFLDIDFKKNDGFKKASMLSSEFGFYRQNYCGCIYSLLERRKDSGWAKLVRANILNSMEHE